MKRLSRILGVTSAAVLSAGVLGAAAPIASASHNVYPPGWNQPANVPPSTFEFRSGWGWNDIHRYWPGQTTPGSAKSHSMTYGATIYQMEPQVIGITA